MIETYKFFTPFTCAHWIAKPTHVAGGFPDTGVHDDGGVDGDDLDGVAIGAGGRAGDGVFPPGILEVLFELSAQRAVVPKAVDPAVDFGGLPDKTTSTTECDDVIHVLDGVRLFAHVVNLKLKLMYTLP